MEKSGLNLSEALKTYFNNHASCYPSQIVIHIGIQLVHALHDLHQIGYLHGDVKPCNVLLHDAHSYSVKLIDFGAAIEEPAGYIQNNNRVNDYTNLGFSLAHLYMGRFPWSYSSSIGVAEYTYLGNDFPYDACGELRPAMEHYFSHLQGLSNCMHPDPLVLVHSLQKCKP